MDTALREYIKKEVNKGFSLDQIRKILIEAGHDKHTVEAELDDIHNLLKQSRKNYLKSFNSKNLVMIFFILIIILLFFATPYFNLNFIESYAFNETADNSTGSEENIESVPEENITEDIKTNVSRIEPKEDRMQQFSRHYSSGLDFYNNKEYENAIEEFDKALEINADGPRLYNLIGVSYYRIGDYEKAQESLVLSLELDQKNLNALNQLGWAYFKLKNYNQSEEVFNQVLEIDPNQENPYTGLGWIYYNQNRSNLAEEMFEKALEIDNSSLWANKGLEYIKNSYK